MALFFIGLGLNDEKDITVKGLEALKKCTSIYLDNYTSTFSSRKEELEKFYNKEIIIADRSIVENDKNNLILESSKKHDTAFLIIGDTMSATTHIDLMLRAKKSNIKYEIIHNASILTAIGITGLQLYKFGKTSSIPFNNENIEVPYDNLKINLKNDLHSLFLLDLDPKNKNYLSINDSLRYLLKIEIKRGENIIKDSTMCIGCQKIGSKDQKILYAKSSDLIRERFTQYPQCLIIPSKLHFMEEEALELWK